MKRSLTQDMIQYLEAIGLRFRTWVKSKSRSNNDLERDDWQFMNDGKSYKSKGSRSGRSGRNKSRSQSQLFRLGT